MHLYKTGSVSGTEVTEMVLLAIKLPLFSKTKWD